MDFLVYRLLMIQPETVPERHYFLEQLHSLQWIWGIRLTGVVVLIGAMVIYRRMMRKSGK